MNQANIKFAIVGAGHIGKRHAEMILRDPEGELVALCDVRSPEDCDATHFNVPHFESIDKLFESELEFDVVAICTPNGMHANQAIFALERGKHVVVEKPMGLTKKSCEKVIFTALQKNKQVFCVMQNRYSPQPCGLNPS